MFVVNTFYEGDLLGRRCAGNSAVVRNLSSRAIKRSTAIEGREKAGGRSGGERLALKRRRGTDKKRSRDVSSARISRITDSSKSGNLGRWKVCFQLSTRTQRSKFRRFANEWVIISLIFLNILTIINFPFWLHILKK